MVSAFSFLPRKLLLRRFCSVLTIVFLLSGWLSAQPPHAAVPPPGFAPYLAQHQADLAPFFLENGPLLLKDALPIFVTLMGKIILATAVAAWAFDVLLGWGFSTLVSPAYARVTRGLVYATGRLLLAGGLTLLLGFAAVTGVNAGAGWPALLVVILLTVLALVVQIFWVAWLYHCSSRDSGLFYAVLLLVHSLIGCILIAVFFSGEVNGAIKRFVDESVTARLQLAALAVNKDNAAVVEQRDREQDHVTSLLNQLAQDRADESSLRQAISQQKNSPAYAFSRLIQLRAQGRLREAATGLSDFIAHHPEDPAAGAARGQLAQINQEVSAQMSAERAEAAVNTRAAAQARARLLARAAAGQATLSEMRGALLGKTMAQVYSLFGAPSERGADRWGYGRHMVFDAQTGETRGLTVVFTEGLVQGVDYYYGMGP